MRHQMRAEYEATPTDRTPTRPSERGRLKSWHMVRGDESVAMCGRELEPDAETQSEEAWGSDLGVTFCHTCGALYLREVP